MKKILRRLIRYASIFFAILLVLAFLSPNISPERIWFPSFLGLAYPYILFFNIFLLVFWIYMKKREFIIPFLSLLLGWNTMVGYFGIHPGSLFRKAKYQELDRTERYSDRQLKLMSFNVRAFDLYRWTNIPSARQEILGLFQENDPDILCLQEFFSVEHGKFRSNDLYKALKSTPHRHIVHTLSRQNTNYGIAIFSYYPIVSSGSIDFDNSLSICSYADLRVFGDTLRVYNMHLQSIRLNSRHYRLLDSLKFRYDNQQMEEIKDISTRLRDAFIKRSAQADLIAEHIENCPYPVIVCGDFNDTPVSYTYKRIKGDMEDSFSESGWGVGRTYNGKFPSFRIDYILCGSDFDALYFARRKVELSDHFPIISYMRFREKKIPGEQLRGLIQQ